MSDESILKLNQKNKRNKKIKIRKHNKNKYEEFDLIK